MTTAFRQAAGLLTAAVLLAGCGGGGGTARLAPPAQPVNAGNASSATAPVTLTFSIPHTPSAMRRAPRYITAATAAITVTLTAVANPTTHAPVTPAGGLPHVTTLHVTSTAQNPNTPGQCGADPANAGNVKCTETIDLPLGDDALTIATYDGFSGGNASGNVISQQRVVVSVVQGAVNTFAFTLDANSGGFTVTAPAGVTLASGANCTGSTISGAGDISSTCTATIAGTSATNFTVAVADAHGSTIPLGAPGAPSLSATSSNTANVGVALSGGTLTITPHAVSVSATVTVTATPANTSGASPGDGLAIVPLAFTVHSIAGTVSWKTRTSTGLKRQLGGAGAVNDVLYLAGGFTEVLPGPSPILNNGSTQKYDPATTLWTPQTLMPHPRTLVTGGTLNGVFYVSGGDDAGGLEATVDAFDSALGTWSTVHAMNHARHRHRMVAANGRLFAFGGQDSGGTVTASVESYNPATDTWTDVAPMPTARYNVAVGVLGGFIYVIGGGTQALASVATVERYDPVANTWSTTIAPFPTHLVYQHAAPINGLLYVAGGYDGVGPPPLPVNLTYSYDPATNAWTHGPDMPVASNIYEASAAGNNKLYIVGLGANFDQLIELSSP